MLRKLRNIFFSLLAVLLIVVASLSALVATETGSRWVVTRAATWAGVSLGELSGNLRTGLDVTFIEYRDATQHYRAEQVSVRWHPGALLYRTLAIDSLQAKNILVQVPPAAAKKPPEAPFSQWPSLSLPVRIYLEQLSLENIHYQQGSTRLAWQKLSGSLGLGTFNLRYDNLALVHSDYTLQVTGETNVGFPYVTDARLQWQWQAPVQDAAAPALIYKGSTHLTGSLLDVQLTNQISSPLVLNADAKAQLVDKKKQLQSLPPLTLALSWQQQTLPAAWWVPGKPAPVTSGKLTATGNWRKYKAQLVGDINLPDTPTLAIRASAAGDLENIQVDLLHIRAVEPVLESTATPTDTAINSTDTAPIADAVANTVAKVVDPMVVDEDEKGIRLNGNVRWSPHLQWQINAAAKRFDLASVFDNWPSDLNASVTTRGSRKDDIWNADLQDLQIDGEMRGVTVSGAGSLNFDGKNLASESLHLIVGANQLQVNGAIGESFNLDWNLAAPILQQIDDRVTGSIQSKGQLRGNWNTPRLSADATAEKFSWGVYGVDKLNLSVVPQNVEALDKELPKTGTPPVASTALNQDFLAENYQLAFSVNKLRIAANRFSSIQINGNGSINKHQVQSIVKSSAYGRADIKVTGGFDGNEWQGKFTQLAIKLKKVPRWWLTSSKPIRISSSAVQLGNQCLTTKTNLTATVERSDTVEREEVINEWLPNQSPVNNTYDWLGTNKPLLASNVEKYSMPQLCVHGDWATASGARFNAHLDSVPLRQFLSLFKTEVYFAGVMDGSLTLTGKSAALADLDLAANISTRNAELRYQYAGGTTEVYAWRDFFVRATLKTAQFNALAGMEWVGYGQIDASTHLDLAQKKIIDGKLQVQFSDLAPLETLLTFANDVKGDLRADLSLGGTFAQPYLLGDISLRNGTANLPRLGLDLSNIELQVNSTQAGSINLVSQVQSGEGRLSLVGDLHKFGTPDWTLQGFLNGADFQVIALPQLKATLSPDIKLTANSEAMHLSGDAVIPWARANIKRLPESATQVSSDVVIVDDNFSEDKSGLPIRFFTNLNLSLGDDVQFKGFGLNSKLSGKLSLVKDSQRQFFTSGYVSVVDGSYKAYGQTLNIERGRLVFQGPYENPGLDIRASRIIKAEEDIEVGLEIGGTLQRPIADVYSSPQRSESQAMMMLLTGKPADEVTKADASVLVGAMSGLGMDSDGSFATEVTRLFRLDELEIKSDEGIDQSQLWIGKYLTPKLLVRYVVGIFDRAFSLGMEYQLTDNLRLEAESGETQSVDVVYKIER